VQAVAFATDQPSVVVPPLAMLLGVAVSVTAGGGGVTGGETETVTDWDALDPPPAPEQVRVNVVVAVSPVRASEPLTALVPVQPPEAVQLLVLAVDQLRVEVPPFATVVGDALSVTVGEGVALGGVTVTVTDCDALPPAPAHASVYVVVAASPDRASDPESALLPVQPPEAVQLVALVTVQLSVVPPPLATVVGVALSITDGSGGAAGGTTVTLTDCVAVPPAPEHVRANEEFAVSGPVEALPEVALLPLQLPDAEQPVASVDDQASVAALPEFTVDGVADSDTEGPFGADGGAVTLAVTVWPAVPPEPLQVSV
jgi:hypothetical protein